VLGTGDNFVWVAYDVNASATYQNTIDAKVAAAVDVTVTGDSTFNLSPVDGHPAGSRTILLRATKTATGTPVNIPDNTPAGATSAITFTSADTPAGSLVTKVTLQFLATHTWLADLAISFYDQDQTATMTPWQNPAGQLDGGLDQDAAADGDIDFGWAEGAGLVYATEYDNELVNQAWTLKAVDNATADTGTITNYRLLIEYAPPTPMNLTDVIVRKEGFSMRRISA
jgi:hypothetical protein